MNHALRSSMDGIILTRTNVRLQHMPEALLLCLICLSTWMGRSQGSAFCICLNKPIYLELLIYLKLHSNPTQWKKKYNAANDSLASTSSFDGTDRVLHMGSHVVIHCIILLHYLTRNATV